MFPQHVQLALPVNQMILIVLCYPGAVVSNGIYFVLAFGVFS